MLALSSHKTATVLRIAILGAMSPAELDNPLSIDLTARERIARAADKTPDDVALLLHFYKQSYIVQQWLTLK